MGILLEDCIMISYISIKISLGLPAIVWQLYYEDLIFDKIAVLSDGRIIVFRWNVLEVWQEQHKRLDIPVPYSFSTYWYFTKNEASILGRFHQQ